MRANSSVGGNRVYILESQNVRVKFWASSTYLPQHGVRLLLCLLFGLSLLFVVLLLCVGRINGPENGKQNCYAENSN